MASRLSPPPQPASQMLTVAPVVFEADNIFLTPDMVMECPPSQRLMKSSSFIFCLMSSNGISSLSNNSVWVERGITSMDEFTQILIMPGCGKHAAGCFRRLRLQVRGYRFQVVRA